MKDVNVAVIDNSKTQDEPVSNKINLIQFFKAFVPEPNREIFLRAFGAKKAPDNISARSFRTTLTKLPGIEKQLQQINDKRGIYFVVNSGGNTDEEITHYNAAFIENDDLTIAEQHNQLELCPLLPSIRVETKKSVHAYWLIDGECSEKDWREIQNRLINYFNSDESIKNPSRLMRLPFFNHVSYEETTGSYLYKPVELADFQPERRYTIEQLLASFPPVPIDETKGENINASFPNNELPEWYLRVRDIILAGHTKRENDGYSFKCPLCGTSPDGSAIVFNDGKIYCRKSKGRCKTINMARELGIDVDGCKRRYVERMKQVERTNLSLDGKTYMKNDKEQNDSTDSIDSIDSAKKNKTLQIIPQLDEKALYGKAGFIVKALAKESESSEAALLLQFLTAYGNVVGFKPFCWTEADKQGTNLFTLIVGKTARSGRKGTSWGNIERLFAEADNEWATNCIESNFLASGEGIITRIRDAKNGDSFGVIDKRLLLVEGEFGKVLNIMKRSGESLNSVLRNAFDRKTLGNGRSNEIDCKKATNPHISIVAHITQNELKALLNDADVHNGFLNRFLIVATERTQKLALGGNFWRSDYSPYVNALRSAIEFGKSVDEELSLSEDAKKLWVEIYESYDEEQDAYIDAMTARGEAIMRRLQLIYALLDGSEVVEVVHVEAAKAVWDYCEDSAKYIFGNGLRLSKDAEKLYKALVGNLEGLNRTQQFDVFKKAKRITAEVLDTLNNELCNAGLAEMRELPTNGRTEKILFDTEVHKLKKDELAESAELNELAETKTYSATN